MVVRIVNNLSPAIPMQSPLSSIDIPATFVEEFLKTPSGKWLTIPNERGSKVVSALLELSELLDSGFTTEFFPGGSLPLFSSYEYDWQLDMFPWQPHSVLESLSTAVRTISDAAIIEGCSALLVFIIDKQKQGNSTSCIKKSFGHLSLLACLIYHHSNTILNNKCHQRENIFYWLREVYPSYWSANHSGLSVAWLFQRLLWTISQSNSDVNINASCYFRNVQDIYVEFIGSSLLAPNSSPLMHHVAVVLFSQICST
jgi:hypothetical protein